MLLSVLLSLAQCDPLLTRAVSERLRRVAYDKALYISTVTLLYLQRGIDSAHDVAGMPHG